MTEQIRVGFIGTGGIARRHAQTLLDLDGVEIVAGSDISEDALTQFVEETGASQTYDDYKEMLDDADIDAVSICTPNYLHKEPTIAALQSGCDVMVEKPMAMNADEAQAMVDAAEDNDQQLTIGFQWRLSPEAQALHQYVEHGEIGQPLFARVEAKRRRGIPNWGVFGQKKLQGGGPLIDIGVHIMEMAHYLMGRPEPVTASANTWTYLGDQPSDVRCQWEGWDHETYTVEDLATGFIRFDNGACMAVESSFAAHIEKNKMNVQIMGDKGGCNYDPVQVFKDEAGLMVNVEPAYVGDKGGFDRKIENWVASMRGEEESLCPAEDGLMIQKMLDGLYKSAEEGREVEIQ